MMLGSIQNKSKKSEDQRRNNRREVTNPTGFLFILIDKVGRIMMMNLRTPAGRQGDRWKVRLVPAPV